MIIIKGNTAKGRNMIERYSNYEGFNLSQVYDRWSDAKQRAWDYCYERYLAEGGVAFSICSHNTFGFTVSWVTPEGLRIETPQNSYLVIFPEDC